MFIFRFFKQSFQFKSILKNTNEKIWKYILYFFILILIANFPLSFEAVKNQGSKMDFIIEDFRTDTPTNWTLPNDMVIKGGKLNNNGDTTEYVNKFKNITYVINKQDKISDPTEYKNHIFLYESNILYIDSKGNTLEGLDYFGFSMDEFSFKSLNLSNGVDKEEMFLLFATSMEKSFSKQIVLITLLRNNIIQLVINSIYVVLLAGLVLLFKFGYQNFLTFNQSVKYVILSMGLPAILSFGVGLLSPPFAPVVFQLASGMVVMLVVLTQGKKTFV